MVSNTRELLPEPETPVNTVSRRFGSSTLTSLRLFTRAPCTRIRSWRSATCSADGCVPFFVALLIVSPMVGRSRQLAAASFPVRAASPAAPLGGIRQCEQIQTGQQQQCERQQRHVRHPDDRILLCQGDESNDDGQRKDHGHPAVELPNPLVPVH